MLARGGMPLLGNRRSNLGRSNKALGNENNQLANDFAN
jgi:hypothetical protein